MATPKKIPSAENGLNQNAVTKKKGHPGTEHLETEGFGYSNEFRQ